MTVDVAAETADLATLRTRFAPVIEQLAATAADRDGGRELPYDLVRALAAAGFGALRVPIEFGGSGVSFDTLAELLLDLAAADSNIPQILRAHFLYTELLIQAPDSDERSHWLGRLGSGDLIGGAYTEKTATNQTHFSTTITTDEAGRRVVSGEKYYSTGSLYADWIVTTGEGENDSIAHAIVPATAPGVELVDDWNGFGQRLTASGTTKFHAADITDTAPLPAVAPGSYGTSVAQFWHIAALTGIARRLHEDVVGYVRDRKRYFSQGTGQLPREDAVVQTVVGEISTAKYVTETLARQIATTLGELDEKVRAGSAVDADFDAAEVEVYRAQIAVINTVLAAATRAFDVGGASALSDDKGWDRHWRNARTLASHNPTPYRLVSIGDHDLNGTSPFRAWLSGIDLRDRS